jgi:hypothetical protein
MATATTTKWAMVAAIGLLLGGAGARAGDGWASSSTVAYAEVASASLESSEVGASVGVAHADDDPGADSYDPYTCAAAYGDRFCAAFERCMAAHGFRPCYKRFTR